jgi:hypothetical protein
MVHEWWRDLQRCSGTYALRRNLQRSHCSCMDGFTENFTAVVINYSCGRERNNGGDLNTHGVNSTL